MTPYEKIRGQKYKKEILPLGRQILTRRQSATSLWLDRDTLSDQDLVGRSAGVVRSRAIHRCKEPARRVQQPCS